MIFTKALTFLALAASAASASVDDTHRKLDLTSDGCLASNTCCVPAAACDNAGDNTGTANLSSGSCLGTQACFIAGFSGTFTVGTDSCIGTQSCFAVAMSSGSTVTVGSNSCQGTDACSGLDNGNIVIGDNACNCENCCNDLQDGDVVPDGACNALGPDECQDINGVRNPTIPTYPPNPTPAPTPAPTPVPPPPGTPGSTLEEKWQIGDNPDFTYDSLDFTLTFPITDFIIPGQAKYTTYTQGCKEDGVELNNAEGLIFFPLIDTENTISQNPITLDQQATIPVSIDSEFISSNPAIYSEDTTLGAVTAQVVFCVRFGLHTLGDDMEVNFLETVITLDIDLSDGFQIGSIDVEPRDKLVRTAAQAYEVEGYVCTDEEVPADPALIRNQGAQIRVCVRPDQEARDDGIYMRRIDSFSWQLTSPAEITQEAVVDGLPSSNSLTDLFCAPGELVCNFVSILFASFYATPGEVTGAGIASMQFGGDNTYIDLNDGLGGRQYNADNSLVTEFFKRRNLRKLQEEGEEAAAAEFDLSFDVDQGTLTFSDGSSDASSTVGAIALSMASILGAIALM